MNLETIARLSGVSRSTVSRVINNSPNVSPEARERVLQVIRATNFQPNLAARSLATGSTHILGLVIPMSVGQVFVDPYFPLLIQGVSTACYARDYAVMLWLAEPEYERRTARQILHSGLIDGVVIASIQKDDPLVDAMLERNFPFVLVGRPFEEKFIHYVDVDNADGAFQAVRRLLEVGRKRVATVTGPANTNAGIDRLEGYRRALSQFGVAYDPTLVQEAAFTQESGYQATLRLLPHRPDALFCASDTMAQGAYRAIQEAGLRIPEDIAVAGFDDMPFAAHMQPPLTTVRQPFQQLGSSAVNTLIQVLTSPPRLQPYQVILPTELVIRCSCGGLE